jgi:hypothetical protein
VNWLVQGQDGPGGNFSVSVGSGGITASASTTRAMTSDPIRIAGLSAIEFGAVLSEPVARVSVIPYISLNRNTFLAGELDPGSMPDRAVEPFEGIRDIPFDFDADDRIVADDLDEGFSIVSETGENSLRLSGPGSVSPDLDLDQGLPTAVGIAPSQWSRRPLQDAFGRYRHTLAYIGAGDGLTRAVMPVSIPAAGTWELEIHIPPYAFNFLGSFNLEIVSGDERQSLSYDASLSTPGWNVVGEFQLPAGEVSVEFSDRTDGRLVIADAVGWSPVGPQVPVEESNSR